MVYYPLVTVFPNSSTCWGRICSLSLVFLFILVIFLAFVLYAFSGFPWRRTKIEHQKQKNIPLFLKNVFERHLNVFYKRQKKHEIYFNDVLQVNNKKFWLLFVNKNSSALVTSWRRRIINIDVKRTVANMSAKKCWREWCIPG